ncbi:hypothetical protein T484DRAFT_1766576, partial [Baffinella frigidus]
EPAEGPGHRRRQSHLSLGRYQDCMEMDSEEEVEEQPDAKKRRSVLKGRKPLLRGQEVAMLANGRKPAARGQEVSRPPSLDCSFTEGDDDEEGFVYHEEPAAPSPTVSHIPAPKSKAARTQPAAAPAPAATQPQPQAKAARTQPAAASAQIQAQAPAQAQAQAQAQAAAPAVGGASGALPPLANGAKNPVEFVNSFRAQIEKSMQLIEQEVPP